MGPEGGLFFCRPESRPLLATPLRSGLWSRRFFESEHKMTLPEPTSASEYRPLFATYTSDTYEKRMIEYPRLSVWAGGRGNETPIEVAAYWVTSYILAIASFLAMVYIVGFAARVLHPFA